MAQHSLAGKSLLPPLLFYRTQGAKPCQVVTEIFSRPPQLNDIPPALSVPPFDFPCVWLLQGIWKWEKTKSPTQISPVKRNFSTFLPHLVQICLALLDLHPSVIHSTRQSIFVNALCNYSVPHLCSYEMHTMAMTHMGSSPVPLEKPPPPSFHHTMFKWIPLYKTYIFFFPISGHLEDRLCCLYLVKK